MNFLSSHTSSMVRTYFEECFSIYLSDLPEEDISRLDYTGTSYVDYID